MQASGPIEQVQAELAYQAGQLEDRVDELEHELKVANKMLRLLTLILVSEQEPDPEDSVPS